MEKDLLERTVAFIHSIGIPVEYRSLNEDTFLPGILIDNGSIIIDLQQLKYPGDLLHEAGHIACVPTADRAGLTAISIGQREHHAAEEMMAIAWSFAACKYLAIDPYFVFHEEGYQGGGKAIADQFEEGKYFGVPMLQWAGMTAEPRLAEKLDRPAYPAMVKWLRN
ncbi:MAG: hypothetical protein WC756_14575 [Taibaiella sp.]|jgi:hypothetical protein